MAPRCAAIPGLMHARRDVERARRELAHVVELASHTGGLVPRTEKDHHPDAMANLWLLRAAHEFVAAAAEEDSPPKSCVDYFGHTLLPLCKKIVQHLISDRGVDGVRMDDGGLLTGGVALAGGLRVNSLWYAALEATAEAIKSGVYGSARDPAGHHFERLAGRFRRSFQKAYWCETHHGICSPAARQAEGHGEWPEPDQLLLTMLPASPLPRTKQRQILERITDKALGKLGVQVHHPEFGLVESPLHRVWLAKGTAVDDLKTAHALLSPLVAIRESAKRIGVYPFYRDGEPITAQQKPDPLATAELLGMLEQFLGEPGNG
jgi:hypothetical protein